MAGGYMGKILRVDLSRQALQDEPLPDESVLRRWVGGTGLGLHYLWHETNPQMRATDPDAPLIFITGPLTGTMAPSSADYTVVTLNYEVPYAAGTGHSNGFWGPYLKMAGYDGIIVRGVSERPVYLWVHDGSAEIRDASHHWGKDTRQTESDIKRELGNPDKTSVACIGPGGEAMLYGAAVKNDRNHGAHKGSGGAVMGSKRLKAIAVTGSGQVPIARTGPFLETVDRWAENLVLTPNAWAPHNMKNGGMLRFYSRQRGPQRFHFAFSNMTDVPGEEALHQSFINDVPTWQVEPQPSYNCTIACSYNARITTGPCTGATAFLDGGGENIEAAGAMIGVEDAGVTLMLADYYDAMGVDSSPVGCVIAMAFELYNRGLITKEDTDGLELTWGNHEAAMALLDKMVKREGFGAVLAQGMKEAAKALHRDAGKCLVHVKGAGINLHDWRHFWSALFSQFIAGAGPCWQAIGRINPEPDFGWEVPVIGVSFQTETLADDARVSQMKKLWEDCTGVCWFATFTIKDSTRLVPQALALATGWEDFDTDEALGLGERVANLMRLFYVQRGFSKEDEFDIGPRLLEPPTSGPGQGKSFGPHLPQLVDEYYQLMGWDVATGSPTRETIARLGLEAYATTGR
ncbi:MAG: aldehyde ferredoxin oxidoreductase family protein [Dehalococcoidia bacterium]